MLHLSGIGHTFGDRWVFRNVDLSIDSPTSIAITGPSGVGKTTLLAIAGGLITPTEGTVKLSVDGRTVTNGATVSWVFQTSNAFANRTALSNIASMLRLFGSSQTEALERAQEALRVVGIAERAEVRARRLSGGELQRLGVARAIAARRPFNFADEPTGQLDEASTEEVARALVAAASQASIVILVTHDRRVARCCSQQYRLSSTGLCRVR